MLAQVQSGALLGIDAIHVQVEVNTGERGDPKVVIVGLPDAAVRESCDRVGSALMNTGFSMPQTRMTVNLAPGDLRKEGPLYDLPIALGILVATGSLMQESLEGLMIAGELGLSGQTRPIKGGLALARAAKANGCKGIILPRVTADEASLVEGLPVYAVGSLDEACAFLEGRTVLERHKAPASLTGPNGHGGEQPDFSEVKGQQQVRRAVEVAVAGGHNLLMIGPPGSGKSMIARRIPTVMPMPAYEEFLEILNIQSAAGKTLQNGVGSRERPFRCPHHTISDVGLLGGGTIPGPGEISLAHRGVLFLDELPEFRRSALEVLRQPMEDGNVSISRSAGKVTLPSSFMLVAAMNPCPCGYLGDPKRECRCSPPQIQRYRARISGPLLDRIDLHVEAPALGFSELRSEQPCESSATMRERIETARGVQATRYGGASKCNALMGPGEVKTHAAITKDLADMLQQAMEQMNLSARAYHRVLKVARTIADLAGAEHIGTAHLLEAIQYRSLDRRFFV